MMTNFTKDVALNLSNCDQEPIHVPGQIQSHGFLIVLNKSLIITHYSENIHQFLPRIPAVLCGLHIGAIEPEIGQNEPPNFINQLITFGMNNGFDQTNPFKTDLQGRRFHLVISPSEDYYLLEFEPAVSQTALDMQKMIGRSISEMLADKNLKTLLKNTAYQIKQVIEYDRVMVYRFADDGHGEVVAEARNEDLESWLGLHYPASDIPKQARELYKKNFTRLIADVHSTPSKISGSADLQGKSLDLTYSQLRAVSPIHIQYLKNMKVNSSFSISLMYRNELWGLIACHNYSPRFIDYKSRESAKLIGQILSSALEFRQDEENQKVKARFKAAVDELTKHMQKSQSIEKALCGEAVTVKDVTNATGAVLVYENNFKQLGETPDLQQLKDLVTWFKKHIKMPVYYTDRLSEAFPDSMAYADVASGVLITTLSEELGEYVIWFKKEQLQVVNWAGNPEKPAEGPVDDLMQISPRKSFEIWSQTVAGKSSSWTHEEIQSALRLKGEIIYSINQKASQIRVLNEKLKQAYEELDTFSYTISHDLKNPLSAIKSYSEILLRDNNLPSDSRKMIGRIAAGTNKMNTMIKEVLEYSRIGNSEIEFREIEMRPLIEEILNDLKIAYNARHLSVNIGPTPAIQGDLLMISQVFSNLLGNAIKYSSNSSVPSISISGDVHDDEIIYCVSDNGIGIDTKKITQVFELFKRLDNAQQFEGSGVGLAIVKRIVEKHKGKIWAESEPGEGSAFYVAFKN